MITKSTRREEGFTLPELLVSMVLIGIVMSLVLLAVLAVHRGQRYSDEDSETLGSLRTGLDRFEREVRQVRRVYPAPASGPTSVKMWVDLPDALSGAYNNVADPEEIITWAVVADADGEGQLVRSTEASPSLRVIARDFVYDAGFEYFEYDAANPQDASLITVVFQADSSVTGEAPVRTVSTSIRLRNVAG